MQAVLWYALGADDFSFSLCVEQPMFDSAVGWGRRGEGSQSRHVCLHVVVGISAVVFVQPVLGAEYLALDLLISASSNSS